jgi:K(+)-stimulated pyrophosphate-energized sodium pump
VLAAFAVALVPALASASEASLVLPDLGGGGTLLFWLGILVCGAGLAFGIMQFVQLSQMPGHRSM